MLESVFSKSLRREFLLLNPGHTNKHTNGATEIVKDGPPPGTVENTLFPPLRGRARTLDSLPGARSVQLATGPAHPC